MSEIVAQIAKDLRLSEHYISATIKASSKAYKSYPIQKRNGEERYVFHPSRRLKIIQKWVAKNVFGIFPVHSSATAYRKGNSNYKNASMHLGAKYLLKLDFEDFFNSITDADIEYFLINAGKAHQLKFSEDDLKLIARAVTRDGTLVIGSPSSPVISNCLMFEFDKFASSICRKHGCIYSRYADDIAISTVAKDVLLDVERQIKVYLSQMLRPTLKLKKEKRQNVSSRTRMTVTGVNITHQGSLSVGRQTKRNIRKMIHDVTIGKSDIFSMVRLGGLLNYIAPFEPAFIASIEKKYGQEIVHGIRTTVRELK